MKHFIVEYQKQSATDTLITCNITAAHSIIVSSSEQPFTFLYPYPSIQTYLLLVEHIPHIVPVKSLDTLSLFFLSSVLNCR